MEGEEDHFCQLKAFLENRRADSFSLSASSQLPSAHNKSCTKGASFGVTWSATLRRGTHAKDAVWGHTESLALLGPEPSWSFWRIVEKAKGTVAPLLFVYVFEFCVLPLSFIYLAVASLGLHCCTGLSLVAVSEVSSALHCAGSSLLSLLLCCWAWVLGPWLP